MLVVTKILDPEFKIIFTIIMFLVGGNFETTFRNIQCFE